jgi:hypothetical protein
MSKELADLFIRVVRETEVPRTHITYQEIQSNGMNVLMHNTPNGLPDFKNEKEKLFYFATKINQSLYFK